MESLRTERELWQLILSFASPMPVAPGELVRLLAELNNLFPVAPGEVSWQMPSLSSGAVQFQIGPDGVTSQVTPDFLVGSSPRGWSLQLSSQQLVLRHLQTLRQEGARQVRQALPSDFPDVETFCSVSQRVLGVLPAILLENVKLMSLTASYVIPCTEIYPGALISNALLGQDRGTGYAPRDNIRYVLGLQEQVFETFVGRRYVWNHFTRMVRWFGPEGHLLQNAGVSKGIELRTAIPEPERPEILSPPMEALPRIPMTDIVTFTGPAPGGALRRALEGLKQSIEPGATFNV
jgi:hypothetical protein